MTRQEVKAIAEETLGVEVAIDYDTTGFAEIYTGLGIISRKELDKIDEKLPIQSIHIEKRLVLVVDARGL